MRCGSSGVEWIAAVVGEWLSWASCSFAGCFLVVVSIAEALEVLEFEWVSAVFEWSDVVCLGAPDVEAHGFADWAARSCVDQLLDCVFVVA